MKEIEGSLRQYNPSRKTNVEFCLGSTLSGGRYVVQRLVNRGGTAVVYEAHDVSAHMTCVAIKVR